MSHAQSPHPVVAAAVPPMAVPPVAVVRARERSGPVPVAERYRERLSRYVSRLTAGDAHRAEDIVQETMLRAWLAADEFAGNEDHLAAWLYVVARNLAVDARRRERSVPTGMLPADLFHQAADGGADVADVVADRVTLVRSLAGLSPHHREVLVHVHVYDRSREDTARLLGIPQGTVKSRLHYALSALRQEFAAA